jgi:hypothetical protein
MDRSKHTPTPWRYGSPADAIVAGERESNAQDVMYYGGTLVAESVDHSDREFIIRACNAHEQLVKALEYALLHLRGEERDVDGVEHKARAALAAAEA